MYAPQEATPLSQTVCNISKLFFWVSPSSSIFSLVTSRSFPEVQIGVFPSPSWRCCWGQNLETSACTALCALPSSYSPLVATACNISKQSTKIRLGLEGGGQKQYLPINMSLQKTGYTSQTLVGLPHSSDSKINWLRNFYIKTVIQEMKSFHGIQHISRLLLTKIICEYSSPSAPQQSTYID